MKYCAVCLIAKDEEYYLKEWCEYHLRIGFDALIIYDNGSQIPIKEVLKDFIDIGRVIVHDVPGAFKQSESYTLCIEQYRNEFKWIAFIDSDEFIFPKKTNNIKIFLAEYEDYGGVTANWVNFGTSGLLQRKDNSQIFNFVLTDEKEASLVKSIVQPAKVKTQGVHGATFLGNHYAVSSDHVPIHDNCYSCPFINDKIQINHYTIRTYEDYERKANRRIKMNRWKDTLTFEQIQSQYAKPSLELIKFYNQIKNLDINEYSADCNFSSVNDFTSNILAILSSHHTKKQIVDIELLCCHLSLIFHEEPMIYYFRAVICRLADDLQKSLRFIYTALKLSGSSTIYYEYARILEAMNEFEQSRLAKKHAEYKKYIEDSKCAPISD
jgi:hypothetical protein